MSDSSKNDSLSLNLHEIQAWEHGVQPKELESNFPFDTNAEVKAYVLGQQHFLDNVSEILMQKADNDKKSYENAYDKVLAYCADRSALIAKWYFLHRNSGPH